jgi:hypothetical protein
MSLFSETRRQFSTYIAEGTILNSQSVGSMANRNDADDSAFLRLFECLFAHHSK